jgi:hypothetical protein
MHELGRALEAVNMKALCSLLGPVQHVVQRGGEPCDVVAIEGRDEAPVQCVEDLVRGLVALVLDVLQMAHLAFDILEIFDQLGERFGTRDDVVRALSEHLEEPLLARDQTEAKTAHCSAVSQAA